MQLRDTAYIKQTDIYEAVGAVLGKATADYAVAIASIDDFDEFVNVMSALNVVTLEELDEPKYVYNNSDDDICLLASAIIIMRYPFMSSRGIMGVYDPNREDSEKFLEAQKQLIKYTMYRDFSSGWRHRFGLAMCEDIRNALEMQDGVEEAFNDYVVTEIKSKYGELRWYHSGTYGAEDIIDKIASLYELLSSCVCETCGSMHEVRQTRSGWIESQCVRCGTREYEEHAESNAKYDGVEPSSCLSGILRKYGYVDDGRWIPNSVTSAAWSYLFIEDTESCGTVADKAIQTFYGKTTDRCNLYDKVKAWLPNANIIKLIDKHDTHVIQFGTLTTELAIEALKNAIDEANESNAKRNDLVSAKRNKIIVDVSE